MPWWGWMILGAFLLASEMLVIDTGFYIIFLGLAALITGLATWMDLGLEPWAQWIVFSVLTLVLLLGFRKSLYEKIRGSNIDYKIGPAGEVVTMEQALPAGQKGRLHYRGTDWTILNDGNTAFDAGQQVQISSVAGLTLKLTQINK